MVPLHIVLIINFLCCLSQPKNIRYELAKEAEGIGLTNTSNIAKTSKGTVRFKKNMIATMMNIVPMIKRIVDKAIPAFPFVPKNRSRLMDVPTPKPAPTTIPKTSNDMIKDDGNWNLVLFVETLMKQKNAQMKACTP